MMSQVKIAFSFGFAVLVGVVMPFVLVRLKDSMAWALTAFGLVTGWAAGILASPYQSEANDSPISGKWLQV